jgi:hypothetical protein
MPQHAVRSLHGLSIHLPGNGTGASRWTGGVAPRTGGEGEEVRHVPPVHTWPAWHGIRHPPQLAGSLEVSTPLPKTKYFAQQGTAGLVAFAANWVMQRNRPIVSPATKARPGGLRPLRKALLLIASQTAVSVDGHRIGEPSLHSFSRPYRSVSTYQPSHRPFTRALRHCY